MANANGNVHTGGHWGDVLSEPRAVQDHVGDNPIGRFRSMFDATKGGTQRGSYGGLTIEPQAGNLDHFRGHSNASTGLAYNIRGRATRLEAEVGDALATFQDPIKALYGTRICEGQHVVITRKYVVGGRAVPTPERAPARIVRVQEDVRNVSLIRYGADMEMNLNLFLRPGDAEHEMAMKLNAQKKSLENELVKMGYESIMNTAITLQDAIVRSKPGNGGMEVMRKHAEYIYATSVFGALSRFEFPLQNLVAAAKNASAYRNVVGPGSLMILPHAIPDMLAYTKPYNMEYSITGVSTKDKKPISMPLEGVYEEPMLNMKIMVHHPPAENTWGDVQKRRGNSALTQQRVVQGFVPCVENMHDNRPLGHFRPFGRGDDVFTEDGIVKGIETMVAKKTAIAKLLQELACYDPCTTDDFTTLFTEAAGYKAKFDALNISPEYTNAFTLGEELSAEKFLKHFSPLVQSLFPTDAKKAIEGFLKSIMGKTSPKKLVLVFFIWFSELFGIEKDLQAESFSALLHSSGLHSDPTGHVTKVFKEILKALNESIKPKTKDARMATELGQRAWGYYEEMSRAYLAYLNTLMKIVAAGGKTGDKIADVQGTYGYPFGRWFFELVDEHDTTINALKHMELMDLQKRVAEELTVPNQDAVVYHPILHPRVGSKSIDLDELANYFKVDAPKVHIEALADSMYWSVADFVRLDGIVKYIAVGPTAGTPVPARVTEFNQKQPIWKGEPPVAPSGYAFRRVGFYMSSALIGVPGNETGELLVGYPMTNVSTNQRTESLTVGLRVYLGAVLKQPENVIVIPDVAFDGCYQDEFTAIEGIVDGCFSGVRKIYDTQLRALLQTSGIEGDEIKRHIDVFKANRDVNDYLEPGSPIPSMTNSKPFYQVPHGDLPVFSHTIDGTFYEGTTILAELDADDKVILTSGLQVYKRR